MRVFACVLALLLSIGLICVICLYRVWFGQSGLAAERRMFDEMLGRREDLEATEDDRLLGTGNV